MIITRGRTMVAVTALLTLLAVGCTREVNGVATGQQKIAGTTTACTFVSAPMATVPGEADDEPRVLIPEPSGWEPTTAPDSETFRFGMEHGSLVAGRFAVASVRLKTKVGHHDTATVFDEVRSNAEKDDGNKDLTVDDATVCGYPALTLRYTRVATDQLPTRTETMLFAVVHSVGKTHGAWVTVTTNDADNPAYQRAAETILDGFQVLAPR